MSKLVYGVGYRSKKTPCKVNGKMTYTYSLWTNMLRRCYCESALIKKPAYRGCELSDNFKDFSYFDEWCRSQIGFNLDGYQLDKDILLKNNKIYSEDTCVFVPKEINMSLVKRKGARGLNPIGVSFDKKTGCFRARYSDNGYCKLIGYFDNPIDAFNVYKHKKEGYLKSLAEKHKSHIDIRAYNALMEYNVEITD